MGHAQQWMTPVGRGFETFVGCYMWDIDPRTKQMFAQPWTRQARHIDWVQDHGNGTIEHVLNAEHATSNYVGSRARYATPPAKAETQPFFCTYPTQRPIRPYSQWRNMMH